jgi:DNA-binding LacI/PurR family transcriptional regulator/tetratricopeptide (TPR) repeat protein
MPKTGDSYRKIAESTGQSLSTVFRAAKNKRDKRPIRSPKQQAVIDWFNQHGDAIPQALERFRRRQRRTGYLLGIILPELRTPFFGTLAQQLVSRIHERMSGQQQMSERQTILTITQALEGGRAPQDTQREDGLDACIQQLLRCRVDGIIAVSTDQLPQDVVARAILRGVPVIRIDPALFGERGVSPATSAAASRDGSPDRSSQDNNRSGRRAARALISRGFKDITGIGVLAGPNASDSLGAWNKGFTETYQKLVGNRPGSPLIQYCGVDHASCERAMEVLLNHQPRPKACLALSTALGLSAIRALRRRGLQIPDDLFMLIIDDHREVSSPTPPLTIVADSPQGLAVEAISLMMRQLEENGRADVSDDRAVDERILLGCIADADSFGHYEPLRARLLHHLRTAQGSQNEVAEVDTQLRLAQLDMRSARHSFPQQRLAHVDGILSQIEQQTPDSGRSRETEALRRQYYIVRSAYAERRGDYDEARDYLEQAMQWGQPSGREKCRVWLHQGKLLGNQGVYEDALRRLDNSSAEANRTFSARDLTLFEGNLCMHRGWILGNQGEYLKAQQELEKGKQRMREIKYRAQEIELRGHELEAKRFEHEAKALESGILLNQGWTAQCRGDYRAAADGLRLGCELAEQIRHPVRLCGLLENLSIVSWCRGDFKAARSYASRGLEIAERTGPPARLCGLLETLGWVVLTASVTEAEGVEASDYIHEALDLARGLKHPVRLSSCLQTMSWLTILRKAEGHFDQAAADLDRAIEIARKIGHRFLRSSGLVKRGELRYQQERWQEARDDFSAARDLACNFISEEALGSGPDANTDIIPAVRGQALSGLARVALRQGHLVTARAFAKKCNDIFYAIAFYPRPPDWDMFWSQLELA